MWHEKDDGWIASIILTKFFKMSFIIQSRAVCLFNDTPITSAMPHDIMLCCGALVSGGAVTVFILLNLIYDNALTK
jgi:hypothetical protein